MEKEMQYDIVKLMESLKETYGSKDFQDIIYFKTPIDFKETINDQSYSAKKDIFLLIEEKEGVTSYRYYDEKQQLIAIDFGDSRGLMATGDFFKGRDLEFIQKFLEDISHLDPDDSLSFQQIDSQLNEYAKALGISKEQLLSSATIDLDQKIGISEKGNMQEKEEEKDKIHLKKINENELSQEENQNTLEHLSAKSEVDLDKKVTSKQTLGQILGVPAGGKLIAVYSEHIADNQNTAEFSFLLQKSDGTLEPADMLGQVNGNQPNKDIASINRDGTEVKEQQVNSLYSIDSTSDTHDMLSIKRGNLGVLELSYVKMDPTDNTQGMSIPLETDNIRPVTSEVRNEMNHTKGDRNISENLDEYNTHKEVGCEEVTLEEVDGKQDTGHQHIDENDPEFEQIINELLKVDEISETYNRNDVEKFYFQFTKENPNISLDELTDKIIEMAEQEHELPGRNRY